MSEQPDLFERFNDAIPSEQDQHLQRVKGKTADAIRSFQEERGKSVWNAGDLVAFVVRQGINVAPASCDRILRAMRQSGELNYEVVNRKNSQYRFIET